MPKPIAKPVTFTALAFVLVACTAADPFGDLPDTADRKTEPTTAKSGSSCGGKTGVDPSKFPTCKGTHGGSGRCLSTAEFGERAAEFEKGSCSGDAACIPDDLVREGTAVKLKTCTAVLETEGRCFWALAKSIVESYDLLKGASGTQCEAGMVCTPCVDPRTKEKTGICDLGASASECKDDAAKSGGGAPAAKCPYDGPPVDTSKFPQEDCGSNMVCVETALIPAAQQTKLKACSKGFCAPKKSVAAAGNFVPKTCRSVGNAEGRCTNVSIPAIAEKIDSLPIGGECDADEACAPCFDPFEGTDTGACRSASCDAPKEPKQVFAACCGGRARCIPTTSIEPDSQKSLKQDSCAEANLCVPTALATKPDGLVGAERCKFDGVLFGIGGYEGLCVADCFGGGLLTKPKQGNCPSGLACVPCKNLDPGTPGCK
jgi:hypothetical protein